LGAPIFLYLGHGPTASRDGFASEMAEMAAFFSFFASARPSAFWPAWLPENSGKMLEAEGLAARQDEQKPRLSPGEGFTEGFTVPRNESA
jgi:hypothetical protein